MKFLKILLIIFLVLTAAFAVDFLTGYSVHSDVSYGDKDVNTMDFYLPCDPDDVEGAVLFIHGGRDQVVPLKNAENLMARLDECGVEHDFILLPDSDHSLLQNPLGHLKYYLLLLEYCETYL